MPRRLSVDIETYSDLTLGEVGLYRYTDSPAFDVLLIGWALDDGPVTTVDLTDTAGRTATGDAELRTFLSWLSCADVTVHAFNAVFEWYCLSKLCARLGYPLAAEELLPRMRCTMVHGLYLGYGGSLDAMGKAVGLAEDERKLTAGKALIKLFSCPDAAGRRVPPSRAPDKWRLYKEYNRQDVEAERALERRFAPWPVPEREQPLWQQDARLNAEGVRVARPLVDAARAIWQSERDELTHEAVRLTGLENPNSVARLRAWLAEELQTDAPVSVRKNEVQDLLQDAATPDAARRMLEIRQRLGKTSVAKYDTLAAMTGRGDRVRGLLQFYGAHTGRWSGRGIQVHNLPKPTLSPPAIAFARGLLAQGVSDPDAARAALNLCFGNLPDTLSQLIRTVLIPGDGLRFVVADYSAIEARVVAWLAGEAWVNEVFATHGKIYEAAAAQMFGVPLDSIRKGGPNYALRAKGKVATLALGYGGGENALAAIGALRMGLTEGELPDIVKRWRAANSHIKALWYELQAASVEAVNTGARQDVKCLSLLLRGAANDRYLSIRLPSGRELFYPQPKPETGRYGDEELAYKAQTPGGWRTTRAWGGTLTENVVQAIARDCLAELLLRVERLGYSVRFHVHDEVIIEAPAELAEAVLEQLLAAMREPIAWAPGLILKGDGFVSDYYRKD